MNLYTPIWVFIKLALIFLQKQQKIYGQGKPQDKKGVSRAELGGKYEKDLPTFKKMYGVNAMLRTSADNILA